jgi:hypothetical protein
MGGGFDDRPIPDLGVPFHNGEGSDGHVLTDDRGFGNKG